MRRDEKVLGSTPLKKPPPSKKETKESVSRYQPAGTVVGEQRHNIVLAHTLGCESCSGRRNALGQFTKTELFRMAGVGSIEGGDRSIPIRQPWPHGIHPGEALGMAMTLQRRRFPSGRGPAGRHPRRCIDQHRRITPAGSTPSGSVRQGTGEAKAAHRSPSARATNRKVVRPDARPIHRV